MRLNLLLVDADKRQRDRRLTLLQDAGYRVIEAGSYAEALQALEQERIEIILSDILLPAMDGFRLCYEARKRAPLQAIPFILFLPFEMTSWQARLALRFGVNRVLQQTAPPVEILQAIEDLTA